MLPRFWGFAATNTHLCEFDRGDNGQGTAEANQVIDRCRIRKLDDGGCNLLKVELSGIEGKFDEDNSDPLFSRLGR